MRIANPSCSIRELKSIILNKLQTIDGNMTLISVKEDVNHQGVKIIIFMFNLSQLITKYALQTINLHKSWQIKLCNSQINNNNNNSFR